MAGRKPTSKQSHNPWGGIASFAKRVEIARDGEVSKLGKPEYLTNALRDLEGLEMVSVESGADSILWLGAGLPHANEFRVVAKTWSEATEVAAVLATTEVVKLLPDLIDQVGYNLSVL